MKQSGHSLVQYSLIGSIVLVVALVPFARVATNMNHPFKALVSDMKLRVQAPLSVSIEGDRENLSVDMTALDPPGTSVSQNVVQTLGANGATIAYSKRLQDLARRLKSQGKISEQTFNDLIALSNIGHDMARIEGLIESMAQAYGAHQNDAFANTDVMVHGDRQSIEELSQTIGRLNEGTGNEEDGEMLGKFKALQNKILESLKNSPELRALIATEANNISAIAQSTQNTVFQISIKAEPVSSFDDSVASKVSHHSSANICRGGNGRDAGRNCRH